METKNLVHHKLINNSYPLSQRISGQGWILLVQDLISQPVIVSLKNILVSANCRLVCLLRFI